MRVFSTADILLPAAADMTKWACVACDQFTSEPEYWAEAGRIVGDAPGALKLIYPEAWLGRPDEEEIRRDIRRTVDAAKAHGANLELILKDISTVRSQPERLTRWAEIAMEEVSR